MCLKKLVQIQIQEIREVLILNLILILIIQNKNY